MDTPQIRTIKIDSYSDSQTLYIDADKITIGQILLFISNLNNQKIVKPCQQSN